MNINQHEFAREGLSEKAITDWGMNPSGLYSLQAVQVKGSSFIQNTAAVTPWTLNRGLIQVCNSVMH